MEPNPIFHNSYCRLLLRQLLGGSLVLLFGQEEIVKLNLANKDGT
jgi:hypothetical protein